jgi:hypothetical protein
LTRRAARTEMAHNPYIIMDEIADARRRAKRAFERRFGKSMLPLKATRFKHDNGAECVRIFDPETGSWAEYNIAWPRVGRMREHDAENQ